MILITFVTEHNAKIIGFEALTAVAKMKRVVWVMTLCSLVGSSAVLEEYVTVHHIPEDTVFFFNTYINVLRRFVLDRVTQGIVQWRTFVTTKMKHKCFL
jgi:hypothetical protein